MDFDDATELVVTRLGSAGRESAGAVSEAFGLLVVAWPVLAESRPDESWELFGLDVSIAAELLCLAVAQEPAIAWPAGGSASVRRAVVRLVEALAAVLVDAERAPDAVLVTRLECEAAAAQLWRALDAVS